MATRLVKSIKRPASGFAVGGVQTLIAIPTQENGKNTLTITAGANDGLATVARSAGITLLPVVVEFSEGGDNVCSYSDNVNIGANTYGVPTVGFKLEDADDNVLKTAMEAFLFGRHTFVIKTKTGKFKVLGQLNGLKATQANNGGDGTPNGFAGYDLILAGAEPGLSTNITEASFNELLEEVVA